MISTRNTPIRGAIARMIFSLTFAVLCCSSASAQSVAAGQLGQYYRQMEHQLVSEGRLRQDRRVPGLDASTLARNFMAVALRAEYSLRGGAAVQGGQTIPLRRWEQPVRINVMFGTSVSAAQRGQDQAYIRTVAGRLQRASGHSVQVVNGEANFHVLVLSEEERANMRPLLRELAPGMSRAAQNAFLRMRPNTFCMVVAMPARDPSQGYRQAIAVVRAEHPPIMRRSCMEEELAQGMGLPNDSGDALASIFNDDETYGVLTRQDELMLRMLYSDNLRCGMTAGAVDQYVQALAESVLNTG